MDEVNLDTIPHDEDNIAGSDLGRQISPELARFAF